MKSVVFLRMASVLTLLHAVLHTAGGVFGKIESGPAAVAVAAMKANEFMAMGRMGSFWHFYRGMGLGVTIFLAAEGIVFWQLASLAKTDAHRLRPVMATFLLAYLVFAVNSYTYFFLGPVIAELLIAGCFAGAIVTAKAPVPARVAGTA